APRGSPPKPLVVLVRSCHNWASVSLRKSSSTHSISPRHRLSPQAAPQSVPASGDSQVGRCTPLVTYPTGTSLSGQRGNNTCKILRLTWPCRRLTPFTPPLPRVARYAM